jgi:hypothetical protein
MVIFSWLSNAVIPSLSDAAPVLDTIGLLNVFTDRPVEQVEEESDDSEAYSKRLQKRKAEHITKDEDTTGNALPDPDSKRRRVDLEGEIAVPQAPSNAPSDDLYRQRRSTTVSQ